MKGLRLKTCASVYDFLKHNVREEVWAYTVFRALDIANYRSSYCSDAKGRFRFTLTVPETDSASAHAFDVEKLRVAAEKVGEAIDREFEKRDKRINDLEYRIRVLEEKQRP